MLCRTPFQATETDVPVEKAIEGIGCCLNMPLSCTVSDSDQLSSHPPVAKRVIKRKEIEMNKIRTQETEGHGRNGS